MNQECSKVKHVNKDTLITAWQMYDTRPVCLTLFYFQQLQIKTASDSLYVWLYPVKENHCYVNSSVVALQLYNLLQ